MSDHEFENYLTLIGRLLRLSSTQREAIGEELRDHFESRLAELINRGVSHAEAVRIALAEFGDAAGLAAQFSSITQTRNRRFIMRCTIASIMALAAAVVVALSLWPDNHAAKLINHAVAESPDKPQPAAEQKNLDKLAKAAEQLPDDRDAAMQATLNFITTVDFQGMPLSDALDFLADKFHFPMYVDQPALKAAGLDITSIQVTLSYQRDSIHLKTILDLMLSESNLGYTIRDGILIVSTKEKLDSTLLTRVYDCRDILSANTGRFRGTTLHSNNKQQTEGNSNPQPGGATPTDPALTKLEESGNKTATKGVDAGSDLAGSVANKPRTPVDDLADVIKTTVAPNSWIEQGGLGSICDYDGLLVINQTSEVQSQVADLLSQLSSKLTVRPVAKPAN